MHKEYYGFIANDDEETENAESNGGLLAGQINK